MPDERVGDWTGGVPWRIVREQKIGNRTLQLEYLLQDGTRRTITLDAAADTLGLRAGIGDALVKGTRIYGHSR